MTNNSIREILGLPLLKEHRYIFEINQVDGLSEDQNNTLMFCNRDIDIKMRGKNNVILVDSDISSHQDIQDNWNDIIFIPNAKYKFCLAQSATKLPSYFQRKCIEKDIGKNCQIDDSVILGGTDFSPVLTDEGKLIQFPQMGGIHIGDDVVIKYNSMVGKGTFGYTFIDDNTMIDYGCQIGHNCRIGKSCIIAAGTIIGGSTFIGDHTTIGMGAVIRNSINIGFNVSIGMGAVVTKDVPSNTVVVGNPARPIEHDPIFSEKGLV